MIEVPESKTLADQINIALSGKTIQNVDVNASHKFTWFHGDPKGYQNLSSGKKIEKANAIGGQVEIIAEDMRIVFSDGTNARFYVPDEKMPEKYQLKIEFDDFSCLICSVQICAFLLAFKDGECDNFYYKTSKEKPSPLSSKFDRDYFEKLFIECNEKYSIKAFLTTEQRIPGVGNGVLQDILFNARIHPKRKIGTLSENEKSMLFIKTKETLFEMTVEGGRDTEKDLFNCPGGYKTILSNKTYKSSCPECGNEITRMTYLGGNVYFCANCQK